LQHPSELSNILLYHVLDHRVYADGIQNFEAVKTVQGQDIVFIISNGKILVNGVATIIAANVDCTNGVVHLIDTVIVPKNTSIAANKWAAEHPPLLNIVQLAQSVPTLSTLVTAVVAGGLANTLSGSGPFTVFAPTNDAFDALPDGVLNFLLNDIKALDTVLTYHVVAGTIYSKQIVNGQQVATIEGQNVTATVTGSTVYINDAQVISADNQASNGVVHIVNGVLLPKGAPQVSKKLRSGR
jgi:transforming growth factor-beta-induced protein